MLVKEGKAMQAEPTKPNEPDLDLDPTAEIDLQTVREIWEQIVNEPDVYLVDMLKGQTEQKIAFAAGGGLPRMFGTENDIWKKMLESMENEQLTIAGVTFTKSELLALGDFYRYISKEGIILHCIDERCVDDTINAESEVHEQCGACAAVGAAIKAKTAEAINVEEMLQTALHPNVPKQPIHPEMQHEHDSVVILIDLSGADIVNHASRDELRAAHALPFNVSLPLELIQTYIDYLQGSNDDVHEQVVTLVEALVKWNVQIASNIIGGSHNRLQELASQTILAIDRRGIPSSSDHLLQMFVKASTVVPHAVVLRIEDQHPAA